MIKFFRHIRKKLLRENSFSKYLLYAFGEIVLVVIGILIALQINNWNEDQKQRAEEIFPTRFDGLWNTRDGAMIPHDYEALKKDKVYAYFLRSLDAQLWYYVQAPLVQAQEKAEKLVATLDEELGMLQGNRSDKSNGSVISKKEN